MSLNKREDIVEGGRLDWVVIPGVICLDLSEVMGATHSYKSFNTDTHQEVDADAEGNSTTKRLKL